MGLSAKISKLNYDKLKDIINHSEGYSHFMQNMSLLMIFNFLSIETGGKMSIKLFVDYIIRVVYILPLRCFYIIRVVYMMLLPI